MLFSLGAIGVRVIEDRFGAPLSVCIISGLIAGVLELAMKALMGGLRLFQQFALALERALELHQAGLAPLDGGAGGLDIALELVARTLGMAQGGRGFGLGVPKRLDRVLGLFRLHHGAGGGAQGELGLGVGLLELDARRFHRFARFLPAADPQKGFEIADGLGEVAIAARLLGLALQGGMAAVEILDDLQNAIEIGLGRVELELGFAAACAQSGDSGGFFQNAAAVFRLGVDQLADLALTDKGGRVRARARIGEQQLDVLGADFLVIDLVVRTLAARDPADDFEHVMVVEPRGRALVGIVDDQGDFGVIAGRAAVGAGEDHVFHAAATQGFRRGGAHHPAQGFKQVGFTAAVRTDNAGQPGVDPQLGRVNKRFEAGQA